MVNIQVLFLSFILVLMVSCRKPSCSKEFTTSYLKMQSLYSETYSVSVSNEQKNALRDSLNSFLITYKDGYKCKWGDDEYEIRPEVQSLYNEITTLNKKLINKVIYGDDNRTEVDLASDSRHRLWARSVAGMIKNSSINSDYTIDSGIIGEEYELCSGERFFHQQNPMSCTGFLVGEDLLVTAGHCVSNASDCRNYSWVFEYKESTDVLNPNDIYSCEKIVSRELQSGGLDYAVIKLKRKVIDREPLNFRRGGEVNLGTDLVVIGHPTGLPLKVAADATVRSNSDKEYFTTNLDTFGGNSGSPVFNNVTGEIEGILVRGENDYTYDSVNSCYRVFKCSMTGCRGEDVTRITKVSDLPDVHGPIDGGWTDWSVWTICHAGMQNRTRSCTNPIPGNGGNDCAGDDYQEQACINITKDQVMNGLFGSENFEDFKGPIYSFKRYYQNDYEILGKKFLGICGIHTKEISSNEWHSSFVGDCNFQSSKIDKVFYDFEELILR